MPELSCPPPPPGLTHTPVCHVSEATLDSLKCACVSKLLLPIAECFGRRRRAAVSCFVRSLTQQQRITCDLRVAIRVKE